MVIRKRKKSVRAHGYKTHFSGVGGKQNRGKGCRGGSGRAGHGKRAGHNKLMYINEEKKKGFFYPLGRKVKKINLDELNKFNDKEINLTEKGYDKLLGSGVVLKPFKVKVRYYSKKAKEKLEKAGGEIIEI